MAGPEGAITWTMLLSRWTEFAKAAVALPTQGEGARWRAAVPDVIALQALTHALAELDSLSDQGQRAPAIDLAEVQVGRHAEALNGHWKSEPLPVQLAELIGDARAALRGARAVGCEWTVEAEVMVGEHPAELVQELVATDFAGDLFLPTPGVALFAGCPAAFARGRYGAPVSSAHAELIGGFLGDVSPPERVPCFRQIYRQFDFGAGRAVRDLVVPEFDELRGGQPLLVPAILSSRPCPVTLPVRGASAQEPLPLVFAGPGAES